MVRKPAFQCFDSTKSRGKCLTSLETHVYILDQLIIHIKHHVTCAFSVHIMIEILNSDELHAHLDAEV